MTIQSLKKQQYKVRKSNNIEQVKNNNMRLAKCNIEI